MDLCPKLCGGHESWRQASSTSGRTAELHKGCLFAAAHRPRYHATEDRCADSVSSQVAMRREVASSCQMPDARCHHGGSTACRISLAHATPRVSTRTAVSFVRQCPSCGSLGLLLERALPRRRTPSAAVRLPLAAAPMVRMGWMRVMPTAASPAARVPTPRVRSR